MSDRTQVSEGAEPHDEHPLRLAGFQRDDLTGDKQVKKCIVKGCDYTVTMGFDE